MYVMGKGRFWISVQSYQTISFWKRYTYDQKNQRIEHWCSPHGHTHTERLWTHVQFSSMSHRRLMVFVVVFYFVMKKENTHFTIVLPGGILFIRNFAVCELSFLLIYGKELDYWNEGYNFSSTHMNLWLYACESVDCISTQRNVTNSIIYIISLNNPHIHIYPVYLPFYAVDDCAEYLSLFIRSFARSFVRRNFCEEMCVCMCKRVHVHEVILSVLVCLCEIVSMSVWLGYSVNAYVHLMIIWYLYLALSVAFRYCDNSCCCCLLLSRDFSSSSLVVIIIIVVVCCFAFDTI